jgi:predicted FMN-binding regulatory protein PaiB
MYLPRHFEPTDAPAMHALMRAYPLANVLLPGCIDDAIVRTTP